MAAFMAGEICSGVSTCRFWFGSKNRAIGLPPLSVTVLVCGSGPSTRSVETLFTLSLASLVTSPNPAASGNVMPATSTPATTHSASNMPIGRSSSRGDLTERGYAGPRGRSGQPGDRRTE